MADMMRLRTNIRQRLVTSCFRFGQNSCARFAEFGKPERDKDLVLVGRMRFGQRLECDNWKTLVLPFLEIAFVNGERHHLVGAVGIEIHACNFSKRRRAENYGFVQDSTPSATGSNKRTASITQSISASDMSLNIGSRIRR